MDIRKARKNAKMTQEELAEKIDVNRATLSKYENGQIDPSISMLRKICSALNCGLADIMTKEEMHGRMQRIIEVANDEATRKMEDDVDSIIADLEAHKDEPKDLDLLAAFRLLNKDGQRIAIERVEELTQIAKYKLKTHIEPLPADQQGKTFTTQKKPPEGQKNPKDSK